MKKFVLSIVSAIAIAGFASNAAFACDGSDAMEKAHKLAKQADTPGTVPDTELDNFRAWMNEAGTALVAHDYDKACEIYDAIADAYGLEKWVRP